MATRTDLEQIAREGVAAYQRGDLRSAFQAFGEVTRSGQASAQMWLMLAQVASGLGEIVPAQRALDEVLKDDGRNPFALLMRGDLYAAAGDERASVAFYRMGVNACAALPDLPGDLPQRRAKAERAIETANQRFDAHLLGELKAAGHDRLPPRMHEALRIANGECGVQLQQPTSFYYPGLPQRAWYEADDFAWASAVEAKADAIRTEAEAALAAGAGIAPYVTAAADRPSRGHSLLDDARWSAFYLWRDGAPVAGQSERCPEAMAGLASTPMPVIAGRSPMALFSILRPGTHIQPHHGMLNTRLICHLPLIVPDGCRLRVGNETRAVVPGKLMIFDDSIEHEAWNDGDAVRVVMLFEIWRPELDASERAALTAMYQAIGNYGSG